MYFVASELLRVALWGLGGGGSFKIYMNSRL